MTTIVSTRLIDIAERQSRGRRHDVVFATVIGLLALVCASIVL